MDVRAAMAFEAGKPLSIETVQREVPHEGEECEYRLSCKTNLGSTQRPANVPRIVDWYVEGKINIDSRVTHALPLERIDEGFDVMPRAASIRSVVVY